MRILHVITSLECGGAQAMLRDLISGWKQGDEHQILYFHDGSYVDQLRASGIQVLRVRGLVCTYDPFFFINLAIKTLRFKPDCIHALLWSSNLIMSFLGRIFKIPVVCDLHCNAAHLGSRRAFFERVTISCASRLVAVSHSVKNSYEKTFLPASSVVTREPKFEKLVLVENGINADRLVCADEDAMQLRRICGFGESDFVVGAVGRLVHVKRYDVLLRACADSVLRNSAKTQKRPLRVCIVGDGPEGEKLQQLAKDLKIESYVFFAGTSYNLAPFYRMFNCMAITSEYEGLSMVLLEALSCGVAVISTPTKRQNGSVAHDVITHNKTGFLVDVADPVGLACQLFTLLHDQSLVSFVGAKAKQLVKDRYSVGGMIEHHRKVYQSVCLK